MAPYRLGGDRIAFGLRGRRAEAYVGGVAEEIALYLFEPKASVIHLVFARSLSGYVDIAGEWNADGTRNHEMTARESVPIVLPTVTAGYHDLMLLECETGQRTKYVWSLRLLHYQPPPASAL